MDFCDGMTNQLKNTGIKGNFSHKFLHNSLETKGKELQPDLREKTFDVGSDAEKILLSSPQYEHSLHSLKKYELKREAKPTVITVFGEQSSGILYDIGKSGEQLKKAAKKEQQYHLEKETFDVASSADEFLILPDSAKYKNSLNPSVNYLCMVATKLKKEKNPIEIADLGEQLFESFYEIGKSGEQLTEDQIDQILKTVEEILPAIDDCVFNLRLEFNPDLGHHSLILRSGIEFLRQVLRGAKPTVPFLKDINLENLELFDEVLNDWKHNPFFTIESVSHSPEDLKRPKFIPESHSWWY